MTARMLSAAWVGLAAASVALSGCGHSRGGCCSGTGPGGCSGRTNDSAPAVAPPPALPATPGVAAAPVAKLYGGQKTCPVMGDELGAMGPPIPVNVRGDTVYVCCRGCVAKVQRDPDKYLPKVLAERGATQ